MYECTNPRYCAMRERFDTVEEFLDMCAHAFNVAPLLTARNCGDEYHDEHGEVALRAVWP